MQGNSIAPGFCCLNLQGDELSFFQVAQCDQHTEWGLSCWSDQLSCALNNEIVTASQAFIGCQSIYQRIVSYKLMPSKVAVHTAAAVGCSYWLQRNEKSICCLHKS